MATVQRTLQRSELRILAILGVPTFALALAITTVSTYLPVLAEDFSDSTIVIGLLIGGEGLIALWLPLVVGVVVGPPAHAARQPAAVHPRRHPGARAVARGAGLRDHDRRGRRRRRGLLRRLLRRLRALPRAVPGPRRRRHRRARPEQPGDLPRAGDVPGAGRRRPAHLDLRAAALHRRRRHRRRQPGRLLHGRRAPPPARAARPRGGGLRGRPRRGRPGARQSRAAGLPRRQRALGAGAGGPEDLRRALRDQDARALAGGLVAGRRVGRDHRARRRARQRQARRQPRARARDARGARRLRRRPVRPLRQHGALGRGARRAARGLRRRGDDVAPLRAAHADDAARRPRRRHRPVLAQPRGRDVAGPAPGRRGHPGGRRRLPLDLAGVRRRDPRLDPGDGARCATSDGDWPVSQ